jgi:hypothetical protein
MAKGKPTSEQRSQIEAQRRAAQAALDKNRVKTGRSSARSLTPRERAAYQRVIARTDKLLGSASKPRKNGVGGLRSGLRTLKAFAERIRSGHKELKQIPERTK